MKGLNSGQKIIILGTILLEFISFLFPPWVSQSYNSLGIPLFESEGYKFILRPPGGFNISIDFGRLLIQSLIILIGGSILFFIFSWNFFKESKKNFNIISDNSSGFQYSKTSHFKNREEYEKWKKDGLELLIKGKINREHLPIPRINTRWLFIYTYIYLPFTILTSFAYPLAEYDKMVEKLSLKSSVPIFRNQQEELEWLNKTTEDLNKAGFSEEEIKKFFDDYFQKLNRPKKIKFNYLILVPIIFCDILTCLLIFGLHKRYLWAWYANWIFICSETLLAPLPYAKETTIYLSMVILWGILFFLPNFIYFKKRKILFH